MRRPDASPSGRMRSGNTPLRGRHDTIPQPNILTQRPHVVDTRTLSPNKLNATKKPLISPKLTNDRNFAHHHRSSKLQCVNHPERQAQYRINISGEALIYCERCAAHLASQGFKVDRLQQQQYKKKSLGSYAFGNRASYTKYEGHPRTGEIVEFLESLKEVDACMRENSRHLVDIQSHYATQIRQLEEFYNGIVCYINYVRNQHVGLLKEESRKYVQIGLIQYGNNEENLEEIGCMAHDIESHMESIVTAVSEEHFREFMNDYNKNLEIYRHRLEEQNQTMGQVTAIRLDELQAKLLDVKRCVGELLGVKAQEFNSNNFSFQASKESQPVRKFLGKENRGPFRNLFEDQESLPCPDESPQFKSR